MPLGEVPTVIGVPIKAPVCSLISSTWFCEDSATQAIVFAEDGGGGGGLGVHGGLTFGRDLPMTFARCGTLCVTTEGLTFGGRRRCLRDQGDAEERRHRKCGRHDHSQAASHVTTRRRASAAGCAVP